MSVVLIWAGVAVTVLTAARLLVVRDRAERRNVFLRLHFIAPGTVLGAPLVILGLALAAWSSWHDVVKLVLIGALLFGTGPAAVITAARAAGPHREARRG